MKERFNLAAIIEELEEQKKMIMSVAQSAKENIEENNVDKVKMKAVGVKLQVMEELEEIQQLLDNLGDKTKEAVDASEDDLQESWNAAKKVIDKTEDAVAKMLKK